MVVLGWGTAASANVCPFCSAINLTFTEQLDSNDVVVVAKLLEVPPPSEDPDADFPRAKFEIVQVIKGDDLVAAEMKFHTQLVGSYPVGQKFLVMGVDPPQIAWTTPMKASDRVFKYLSDIQSLPPSGAKRLVFFQDYFEDKESILAFDAYDEFAKAPYSDLVELKDRMQRDQLINWIQNPDTSVNRRRLYFTMLGVCGTEQDIKIMESLIRSGDRKKMAGLDALIASYLTLKGADGVDLIEETFLADPDSDYVDANSAVSALRFHGTELDRIPKDRIVKAVRHLLDRPKMADMIIPDLARWEDWSVMERLVKMFKDADEESNWLRVPVITYLRACPKPEAKEYIEELAEIDPDAVRRADFFLGGFGDEDEDEAEDEAATEDKAEEETESDEAMIEYPIDGRSVGHVVRKVPVEASESSDDVELVDRSSVVSSIASKTLANSLSTRSLSSSSPNIPAAELSPRVAESVPVATVANPNLTRMIIFVPMGVSLAIFLLLWSVVSGWFERLIF